MYHLTKKSKNKKVSDLKNKVYVPVSTSSFSTCPDNCSLKKVITEDGVETNGCYGDDYHLSMHWKKVSNGERVHTDFMEQIAALPDGTLWRHNQAGDLAGDNNHIDGGELKKLVKANTGKRGYTYTHKPMDNANNRNAVQHANNNGFIINLSAENLKQSDELADLGIAPVAVVLPSDHVGNTKTPKGRKVIQCPATREGDTTTSCARCKLCAISRDFIIGFPAHGAGKNKANAVAIR
jgi:hypothetical protein|tara:strand:+ start:163 stop:873 length:711 start_codon:yes stop_codon:yes gene_type:complete